MTRKVSRPAPSHPTSKAGRLMTANRTTQGAIGQGGDDIIQGRTGREARRGANRRAGRRTERRTERRAASKQIARDDEMTDTRRHRREPSKQQAEEMG